MRMCCVLVWCEAVLVTVFILFLKNKNEAAVYNYLEQEDLKERPSTAAEMGPITAMFGAEIVCSRCFGGGWAVKRAVCYVACYVGLKRERELYESNEKRQTTNDESVSPPARARDTRSLLTVAACAAPS